MEPRLKPSADALGNSTTSTNSSCALLMHEYDRLITLYMIVPAVVFIFALSFIVRRSRRCPGCCLGRPAVVQPLNMVDDFGRRWAFAACYIIITYNIISLFVGEYVWNPLLGADKLWLAKFGWLQVFVKLGNVLHVCLDYYPLFACISHRRHIAANVLGFVYTMPFFVFEIIRLRLCPVDVNSSTHTKVAEFVCRLPATVSLFLLLFAYAFDFVCNVRRSCVKWQKPSYELKSAQVVELIETVDERYRPCVLYVKELLRRKERKEKLPEPHTLAHKVKRKITDLVQRVRYRKIVGFKYPVRLICTMAVSTLAVLLIAVTIGDLLDQSIVLLYNPLKELVTIFPPKSALRRLPEYIYGIRVVVALSNALATALHLVFAAHIVITCRNRMHKLFRGSREWFAKSKSSPAERLISGMRYSGYQIAFFIFGWAFSFLLILVVLILFIFLFVLPIRYGERTFLIDKLTDLWPTVLLGLIINYAQVFLCKYLFLQDGGTSLALNNRRLYHVMSFFLFVLNIVVGIFAALKRILLSLIFGTLLLSRLDHVLLMRGFEKFDSGHTAYLSMLLVDVYHNHPVLRSFVLLLQQVRESHLSSPEAAPSGSSDDSRAGPRQTHASKIRYRNKWLKALTLVNNPTLILERLQQQRRRQAGKDNKRDTLEDKLKVQETVEFMLAVTTSRSAPVDTLKPSATELTFRERDVSIGDQHVERKGHDEHVV